MRSIVVIADVRRTECCLPHSRNSAGRIKKVMLLTNKEHVRKQSGKSGGNNRHTMSGSESVKAGFILLATSRVKM
ncbi:NilQ [Xenorhabdus nematophila F1]|nr:protein NilQ [Xenorhabdus nematophila]CCW29018.1 NilQ [Xenorhabdus nematophila F1]